MDSNGGFVKDTHDALTLTLLRWMMELAVASHHSPAAHRICSPITSALCAGSCEYRHM
jgi:hypothetical protein